MNTAATILQHFLGRQDYIAESNGNGFAPHSCPDGILTEWVDEHLSGKKSLGFYVLDDKSCASVSCVDIDDKPDHPNPDWKAQAEKLYSELTMANLRPVVELSQSGSGAHVWMFHSEPIAGWLVRAWWRGWESRVGFRFKEIFPKQDTLSGKGLGNLIRFPLWNKSRFVDVENEWAVIPPEEALRCLQKVDTQDLRTTGHHLGFTLDEQNTSQRPDNGNGFTLGGDIAAALSAMLSIKTNDANDGSLRLFSVCCRGVEGGLSDDDILKVVKLYAVVKPFKTNWKDAQICDRIRAAREKTSTKSDTTNAPLILDRQAPYDIAHEFIRREHRHRDTNTLIRHAGDFYCWSGAQYVRHDEETIKAAAYAFLESARRCTKDSVETIPFKPTKAIVGNVLDALIAAAAAPQDTKPPCWLGHQAGDPIPTDIIACQNGLLHLPTMRLHQPTPRFFNLYALGIDYNEAAKKTPAEWIKFLRSLWPDDRVSVETLQEWFGYIIAGDMRLHKIGLIVGPKRSGKGTIGRVLGSLVGQDNVAAPPLAGLASQFGLQALLGKPLAIIGDARLSGRADQAAVVERLLSISGQDAMTVDRKHRDPVTVFLPTRFLLLTNELPRLQDSSGALASRFIVLVLTESWLGREDTGLCHRLMEGLPQILHWAIEGWHRLKNRGKFQTPSSAAETISELEDLGSPISAFLRDRCQVEPGLSCPIAHLFAAWQAWCQGQGRTKPGSCQTFGRDLRAVIPDLKTSQPRDPVTKKQSDRHYVGVTLLGEYGSPGESV